MKIVLLAGGKGTRLWPATTDNIPKQFLKIFDNSTMIQKIYDQLCKIYNKNDIYISTNKEYKKQIKKILKSFNNFIIEPNSNGTYSAILNISAYFKFKDRLIKEESICILPIDLNVDLDFFEIINEANNKVKKNKKICLIGVTPTFPSEQYGYIIHSGNVVKEFKEKPNKVQALELMSQNALWNTGIVITNLGKLYAHLDKYKFKDYNDFIKRYMEINKGSFDVNVLEKEKKLLVVNSKSKWCDIGLWENLAPILSNKDIYNTDIINLENKKIINDGINNAIIINSKEGLKLIKKKNNIDIKSWGLYEELEIIDDNIKINKINILSGRNTSYKFNTDINLDLFIKSGEGEIIIDGKIEKMYSNKKISIQKNQKYAIKSNNTLEIIIIEYGGVKNNIQEIIESDWEKIMKGGNSL